MYGRAFKKTQTSSSMLLKTSYLYRSRSKEIYKVAMFKSSLCLALSCFVSLLKDETSPLSALHLLDCVLSCLVLSCLVLSCPVLSCLVLSCLVLPCLILACLALSCVTLLCLAWSSLYAVCCLVLSSTRLLPSHLLFCLVFCLSGIHFVLSCLLSVWACLSLSLSLSLSHGLRPTRMS